MRKNNPLTFYISLLHLFLIGITFVSCEAEKDFAKSENGRNMKREISFEQFKKEIGQSNFSTKLSISRGISKDLEDFVIDSSKVKLLETNYVVYSMKLDPKFVPDEGKFYNLFVFRDNTNEVVKQILEILPTTQITVDTEEEIYNYLQTASKELIYSSKMMTTSPICVEVVYVDRCFCDNHTRDECLGCWGFRPMAQLNVVPCPSFGSEPSPAPEPNIEDTGTNNSGGDGGFSAEPVLPSRDQPSPCDNMKNLFNSTKANIKPKILALQSTLNSPTQVREDGVYLKKFANGGYSSPNAPQTNTNAINPVIGPIYYGFIHTHPFLAYPMFSWSDVYSLYQIAQYTDPANLDEVVSILVCRDDYGVSQTYAIKFNQETANTIDNLYSTEEYSGCLPNDITVNGDLALNKKYDKSYDGDKNYERDFLRQTYGFNISLYKASSDLTRWDKLIYNPLTSSVTKIPCN